MIADMKKSSGQPSTYYIHAQFSSTVGKKRIIPRN